MIFKNSVIGEKRSTLKKNIECILINTYALKVLKTNYDCGK